MSYEGHVQLICRNGHAYIEDALAVMYQMSGPEDAPCPTCAAFPVWYNDVDQTNGSYDEAGERIDGHVELEVDQPAEICVCEKCKHKHEAKPPTFKVPEGKGVKLDPTMTEGGEK